VLADLVERRLLWTPSSVHGRRREAGSRGPTRRCRIAAFPALAGSGRGRRRSGGHRPSSPTAAGDGMPSWATDDAIADLPTLTGHRHQRNDGHEQGPRACWGMPGTPCRRSPVPSGLRDGRDHVV